jgi:hypothetical protein
VTAARNKKAGLGLNQTGFFSPVANECDDHSASPQQAPLFDSLEPSNLVKVIAGL